MSVLICSGENEGEDAVVTAVHRHRHGQYGQPGVFGLDFASGQEGSSVLPLRGIFDFTSGGFSVLPSWIRGISD